MAHSQLLDTPLLRFAAEIAFLPPASHCEDNQVRPIHTVGCVIRSSKVGGGVATVISQNFHSI